ncbi:hypothetical protein D3C73_1548900 [compost metagenome]
MPIFPERSREDPTVRSVISVGISPASNRAKPAASTHVSVCNPQTNTRSAPSPLMYSMVSAVCL